MYGGPLGTMLKMPWVVLRETHNQPIGEGAPGYGQLLSTCLVLRPLLHTAETVVQALSAVTHLPRNSIQYRSGGALMMIAAGDRS